MLTTPCRVLAVAVAALAFCGCGSTPSAPEARTVTVFAAASMRSAFTALGQAFESAHPGVRVTFTFAGSQALDDQLNQGARADVFASADEATMRRVTDAGLASGAARRYATNRLTIAVPPDNPAKITGFADLSRPGVKVVVCAPTVPCGAATVKVERAAGVTLDPVSEEQSVSDVVAKVQAGEADAGLVYVTDVRAAGSTVRAIDVPEAASVVTTNSIVALATGSQAALGQEFVDLVLSTDGQTVLAGAGFGKPATSSPGSLNNRGQVPIVQRRKMDNPGQERTVHPRLSE